MQIWMWLVAAGLLVGVEILTADLLFASLALAALAAGIAGAAGLNLVGQIIVAAVFAAVSLGLLRPIALRHLRKQPADAATNVDALIGAAATTLTEVTDSAGQIKLSGEVWSARSTGATLNQDSKVRVVRIDGATAIVEGQ
jgi:membrane protein implicated in regulation of membrane protease activity